MRYWLSILVWVIAMTACTAPAPPKKGGLVSLHPAMTETLFALDAGDRLVGRSDYCLFPAQAKALPAFGTTLTPQIEALANLRPETILVDQSHGSKLELLAGIAPIQPLPWLTLADVKASTKALGDLVNETERAQEWAERYQTHLDGAAPEDGPVAILLIGTGDLTAKNLWYIKPDSLHGSALASAGFRNAIPAGVKGPPSLSIEQLIAHNPDVLLIIAPDGSDATQHTAMGEALKALTPLKAVQQKQIHVLSGENLMGVGPGIIDFAKQLKALREHP